jgi:hypothetical protein
MLWACGGGGAAGARNGCDAFPPAGRRTSCAALMSASRPAFTAPRHEDLGGDAAADHSSRPAHPFEGTSRDPASLASFARHSR